MYMHVDHKIFRSLYKRCIVENSGLAAIRLENYTLAITMICFVSMQFFLVGLFLPFHGLN